MLLALQLTCIFLFRFNQTQSDHFYFERSNCCFADFINLSNSSYNELISQYDQIMT